MPAFRNASSRSRWASVSKLNSTVSKISLSGVKVIFVPRFFVVPVISRSACGFPRCVLLLEHLPVAPDFEVELLRERVDDRHADAVQAAGDLVAVVVELAAGVQHREHDFCRRTPARVLVGRNAAAVVDDRDDPSMWMVTLIWSQKPGERLVDRVVDDFVDEMVQSRRPGRADVHGGPLADRLEAFEDFYFVGAVILVDLIQPRLCSSSTLWLVSVISCIFLSVVCLKNYVDSMLGGRCITPSWA